MKRRSLTLVLLLLLFVAACAPGHRYDVQLPTFDSTIKNVVYGTDTVQQAMDVYLPAGRSITGTPVVVLIHGGSWVTGSKDDFNGLGLDTFFKQNGCAVIIINYRLAGTYKYPAPVNDIGLVMDYLAQKATSWKINPDRVCLMGKSSGSQLALLYAYSRKQDNRVRAVVDGFGPTDFVDSTILYTTLGGNVSYMLGPYTGNNISWFTASPIFHMAGAVPTVIFQGTADTLVYPRQSRLLQDSLLTRGVPCMYVSWPGDGHGWDQNQWLQWRGTTIDWLKRFL